MNTFYYGASVGIRRVNYEERYNHNERLLDTVGTSLRSFNYMYEQYSKGTGLNLKLGVLYLPSEQFRIGLAFESPTVIGMKDEWTADMTAQHNDGLKSVLQVFVPKGRFEYRIKTPMKLRGSFAYILGMRGAVNVDLEMSRLPGGKLKPSNNLQTSANAYTFNLENEEVRIQYRTILNTRIGIEYMVLPDLFLRGGLAILPQPYKKEIGNISTPNMTYSGGIGWENSAFSIDLSYRLLSLSSDYFAFDPSKVENRANFKTNVHNIVVTAGFKF
jgi:long-subunit fatty acid transport protein